MKVAVYRYRDEWASQLADIYHRAVHAIAPSLYSSAAKEVWAPTPPDYGWWAERLASTSPGVALVSGQLAGFIEFGGDGHIDCLYTDPAYQGKGVAAALYARVLAQAKESGLRFLTVDASLAARPFFERRGFSVTRENQLQRNGATLCNFSMCKSLNQGS